MTQRDLIKDQVEQLGRVLGKITALLLDLDTSGDIEHSILEIENQFNENTGLDLKRTVLLPQNEFETLLETKFQGDENAIDRLANMLWQVGRLKKDRYYLLKAVVALKFIHKSSPIYSMDRAQKITDWQNSIAFILKSV